MSLPIQIKLIELRVRQNRRKRWMHRVNMDLHRRADDDDEGRWITTEEGHKVHINAEGEPDKGNPHVLAVMNGGRKSRASVSEQMSKKTAGNKIMAALTGAKTRDEKASGVKSVLSELHSGSKVKIGFGLFTKRGEGDNSWWEPEGYKSRMPLYDSEFADTIVDEHEAGQQTIEVAVSAKSEEEKRAAAEAKKNKVNWRTNPQVWHQGGSLTEKTGVQMYEQDYDSCGLGFCVIGNDGKEYRRYEFGWEDAKTGESLSRAKMEKVLKGAKFEGDFFDINFGLNGINKTECDKAREIYNNMDEGLRTRYDEVFRKKECGVCEGHAVSYCDANGDVYLKRGDDAETIYHEYGHSMDRPAGDLTIPPSQLMEGLCRKTGSKDFQTATSFVGYDSVGGGRVKLETVGGQWTGRSEDGTFRSAVYDAWFGNEVKGIDGAGNISDMFSAVTGSSCGEYKYGWHQPNYWSSTNCNGVNHRYVEFWAEYCQMRAFKQTEALDLAKKLFPNTYAAAEEAYRRMTQSG